MIKKVIKFVAEHILKILGIISGLLAYWFFKNSNKISTGKVEVSKIKKIKYGRAKDDSKKNVITNPITDDERKSFLKRLRKKR